MLRKEQVTCDSGVLFAVGKMHFRELAFCVQLIWCSYGGPCLWKKKALFFKKIWKIGN